MILDTSADANESLLSYEETDRSEKRDRQRGRVRNQLVYSVLEETGGGKVSRGVQEESSHFWFGHGADKPDFNLLPDKLPSCSGVQPHVLGSKALNLRL